MNNIDICITTLPSYDGLPLPKHATNHSAGVDLLAAIEENIPSDIHAAGSCTYIILTESLWI